MLRLVHPPPSGGQGTDPPRRGKGARSPSLFLTVEESRHLRAAMKNTARALGGMNVLAAVTGISPTSIRCIAYRSKRRASAAVALAVARAAGTTVEAVITGQLTDVSRCKACGRAIGDRPVLAGNGGAS